MQNFRSGVVFFFSRLNVKMFAKLTKQKLSSGIILIMEQLPFKARERERERSAFVTLRSSWRNVRSPSFSNYR